jgi:hypothetical protein
VDLERLPVDRGGARRRRAPSAATPGSGAAGGGEDYELLHLRARRGGRAGARPREATGTALTVIGEIEGRRVR